MERRNPGAMIAYSGKLPLGTQIAIAEINIWLGKVLPLWFTRAYTTHAGQRKYFRAQDARIEAAWQKAQKK